MEDLELVEWIRQQMPAVERYVYFNAGTSGPFLLTSQRAIQQAMERELQEGRCLISSLIQFAERSDRFRERIAQWIGASAEEITFTPSTTEGMNIALWGMSWQAEDEIITSTEEHPALLALLATLHQRFQVQIRYLPFTGNQEQDLDLLKATVSRKTKALAVSHVSYTQGIVFPIEEMASYCSKLGIFTLVDGAQAIGTFPVCPRTLGVDAYAAPAQKWLCGPEGTGFLYLREEQLSRHSLAFAGGLSIREMSYFDQTSPHFLPAKGGRRFERSPWFRPLMEGLEASFDFLENGIGWSTVYERSLPLVEKAKKALLEIPQVLLKTPLSNHSNLIAFQTPKRDVDWIVEQLVQRDVLARSIHGNEDFIRLSIGFFNSSEDVEHFVGALKEILPLQEKR